MQYTKLNTTEKHPVVPALVQEMVLATLHRTPPLPTTEMTENCCKISQGRLNYNLLLLSNNYMVGAHYKLPLITPKIVCGRQVKLASLGIYSSVNLFSKVMCLTSELFNIGCWARLGIDNKLGMLGMEQTGNFGRRCT